MTKRYIIAHKVNGKPEFDVAQHMACPECRGEDNCDECRGEGYWWIVPSTGMRAYPYWYNDVLSDVPPLPDYELRDFFEGSQRTAKPKPKPEPKRIRSMLAELGFSVTRPALITRR